MTNWNAMAKGYNEWHLAASLIALGNEINVRWPKRDTSSDGAIGDASHQARKSDHNPDWTAGGVVRAIDVDKDGIDVQALLDATIGDQRVWYVIWDRHIYSRTYGWAKRPYDGASPHTEHIHISINHTTAAETDTSRWFSQHTSGRDELDMDEAKLREIIADELNKQDRDLWANKGGTGKQLVIDRLARVEAAVNDIKAKVK
ncbi:hypothetical protein PWY87_34085 [Kribbella solani]|uniref:hypothetical protein n=1 Tax=Kribbella solani TaxID=236067 RepID=UPI0029AEDF5C|nr:hypothetical protein [Kribbella solani]MDX3006747.1 hypothetical protein [Kribbella solani]